MREVELRPVGPALRLWDVANTEAHVRAILRSGLHMLGSGARLNPSQTQRALQFLWAKCWELSGLEQDGRTPRHVWVVRGFLAPRGPLEPYEPIKLPEFGSDTSAAIALEGVKRERLVAFARIERVRPDGAYDASFGLSFSTYSHRILTLRIIDWYRSDAEFGDSRYSSGHPTESLDALADQWERDGGGGEDYLDRSGPGGRLDFVDELNPHAYQDPLEEVLTREAICR